MSNLMSRCVGWLRHAAIAASVALGGSAAAQSCCATYPVSIDCFGLGQECGFRESFTLMSRSNPATFSITTSPAMCSNVDLNIYINGGLAITFPCVAPGSSSGPFTIAVDLLPWPPIQIEIEAVGCEGGCNTGILTGWSGTIEVCSDQAPIVHDLAPQTLCGLPSSFFASAEAPWPLTYRWYLNNTEIPDDGIVAHGATTNVLTLLPGAVPPGHFTLSYAAISPCGEIVYSNPTLMMLEAGQPPIITLHPESQTGCVGGEAVFRCEATNNSLQVWFYGPASSPTVVLDVPGYIEGSNSDTLRFTNLTEFDDNLEVFSVIFSDCGVTAYSTSAFLTVLPEGACGVPCPADFNQDGGVDGADIDSFFGAWETGDSGADVNLDGGVDGGDIDTFFAAWEAGGC